MFKRSYLFRTSILGIMLVFRECQQKRTNKTMGVHPPIHTDPRKKSVPISGIDVLRTSYFMGSRGFCIPKKLDEHNCLALRGKCKNRGGGGGGSGRAGKKSNCCAWEISWNYNFSSFPWRFPWRF